MIEPLPSSGGPAPRPGRPVRGGGNTSQHLVAAELLASVPGADGAGLAVTIVSTLEAAGMTSQVTRGRAPLLLAGCHLARLRASYTV